MSQLFSSFFSPFVCIQISAGYSPPISDFVVDFVCFLRPCTYFRTVSLLCSPEFSSSQLRLVFPNLTTLTLRPVPSKQSLCFDYFCRCLPNLTSLRLEEFVLSVKLSPSPIECLLPKLKAFAAISVTVSDDDLLQMFEMLPTALLELRLARPALMSTYCAKSLCKQFGNLEIISVSAEMLNYEVQSETWELQKPRLHIYRKQGA